MWYSGVYFLTELASVCLCMCVCICICVCGRVHVCVCGGLPEGSLCAGVSLERQMSRADILGRPGSGQSFIWAEMILALRFGALTQEQCHSILLLLPILFSFLRSFSVTLSFSVSLLLLPLLSLLSFSISGWLLLRRKRRQETRKNEGINSFWMCMFSFF